MTCNISGKLTKWLADRQPVRQATFYPTDCWSARPSDRQDLDLDLDDQSAAPLTGASHRRTVQPWCNVVIGKMRNCGMRKVKCGIQKCGKVCGMVGKTRNAERTVCNVDHRNQLICKQRCLAAVALFNGLKTAVICSLGFNVGAADTMSQRQNYYIMYVSSL